MVFIKSNTLFSNKSLADKVTNNDIENGKISYWLEKLHTQGEEVRKVSKGKEEQKITDAGSRSQNEHSFDEIKTQLTQLGINTYTKNSATKNEADKQMINDLIRRSNRCIISISSSFPWSLFPDTMYVEESRVTFKFSQFLSAQSHSVEIKDISNVFIDSSLFFATLRVVSRTYVQNDIKIGHLNRRKAVKVQRIIEGLRTFSNNSINTSHYEIDELISKIGEFHTSV